MKASSIMTFSWLLTQSMRSLGRDGHFYRITGLSSKWSKLKQPHYYTMDVSYHINCQMLQPSPMQAEDVGEYDPLKWPPDINLAKMHMRCVCPGKDNVEGIECPCCGRFEKIKVKNWYSRNIIKDFKSYGGGVPGYFTMVKYCAVSLLLLAVIVILFHIYIIETTCPLILQLYPKGHPFFFQYNCQSFLFIFKFCDAKIILQTLYHFERSTEADAFFYLQLISFVYLIVATICMKIWLQRVNSKQIVKEEKIYGPFSLMIKNIPKFYQIEDVRKEIELIQPDVQICQLFFVYEIAELENKYKKLFDLHFEVEFIKESISAGRGATREQLMQQIENYGKLYEEIEELKRRLNINNGRAIAVFNDSKQRDQVFKALSISECSKFWFHTMKVLGKNTQKLHFFADKISEPQEIIWKYIGENSVTKTWVRIKTTLLGFGFMIIAFLVLYFPIVKIDENSVEKRGAVSSVLSFLISIILQVLAIVYRQVILKILPSRHPSSKESQSYFVVITTVVFHFFFYIIAPGTYYLLSRIPVNIKLKQLFVAVLLFLVMSVLVAFLDLRFRLFNSRRKNIMKSWLGWGKLCQVRLHEQIRWPSFPIEFKIMVILNIWTFNAFYIFQIPYLMFLFVVSLAIIYWVDKKNIYTHYKMQTFQSIDLEISVQRDYIIMFLICVSCGYAACAYWTWQYILVGVLFVVALMVNFIVEYRNVQTQKKQLEKSMTLTEVIRAHTGDAKQSMMIHIMETQFKENALVLLQNASSVSIGTTVLQYGYKQLYDNYLSQFKNKHITSLLQQTYSEYKNPNYDMEGQIEKMKRVTQLSRLSELHSRREIEMDQSYRTDKVEEVEIQ